MPVFRAEVPRTGPPAHPRPRTPPQRLKESALRAGRAFPRGHGFATRGTHRDVRRRRARATSSRRRQRCGQDGSQPPPRASTGMSRTKSGRPRRRSLPWQTRRQASLPAYAEGIASARQGRTPIAIVSVVILRPATSSRLDGHHDGPDRQCDPTGNDSLEERGASRRCGDLRDRLPATPALAIELAALTQVDATDQPQGVNFHRRNRVNSRAGGHATPPRTSPKRGPASGGDRALLA
jgi:hypothetical protein